jgi:hypothetical protein
LRCGIERFCQEHASTSYVYDIKHKTAAILKQELHKDVTWQAFTRLAAHSKQQVQQTALAFLAPPNQRSKARYMNVEPLIGWGRRLLGHLDQQKWKDNDDLDPGVLNEKW